MSLEHSSSSVAEAGPECFDDNTAAEFIDGLLSDREIARVEEHAARCESCRRLLAELGRSPSLAEDSPTLPKGNHAHISLREGQKVGRFVVLNRIGSGGMGVVFSAYDPKLDRKVALKLLHSPESSSLSPEAAQKRLLREAQAMAQLSHPNVISVYDVGTYESEVYIAMEFVEGDTLTMWLRSYERPWREVLDVFVQAGKALVDAHAAGLVHRDFKPDNVLVGNDSRVRVMDFGLARWLYSDGPVEDDGPLALDMLTAGDQALDRRLTKTGTVLGTPRYMAPEQLSGQPTDARSDQFSFCVALYEALYKQHPFEGNTALGMVEAPENTEVRPQPAGSVVPMWLHKALLRGLAREPADRYASMGALLRALAPAPAPPPRLRFVAPLVVAFLAVATAVYLYKARSDVEDGLVVAQSKNHELSLRLEELEARVASLIEELARARKQIQDARSQPSEVAVLERQLAETKAQLESALVELDATQRQLAQTTRSVTTANVQQATPPRPALEGLALSAVEQRIGEHRAELDTCFREWREREREDAPTLAVRLEIDSLGVPRPGSRSGGLGDRVVYECVAGLLEDIRFPESDGVTVVELGFRTEDGALRVLARIKDVLPDPARAAAEASTGDSGI